MSAVPGVALEAHQSSYWGDPYHGLRDTDLKLTTNADPKFEVGDASEERWFSLAGRDCAYLLWDVPDIDTMLVALTHAGLDVRAVPRP